MAILSIIDHDPTRTHASLQRINPNVFIINKVQINGFLLTVLVSNLGKSVFVNKHSITKVIISLSNPIVGFGATTTYHVRAAKHNELSR